jgi:hypothetical protein
MPSTNAHPSTLSPLWTIYKPRVFSKRTRNRFINDRTGELISHLGRDPTFPEKLLVNRIISLEWWLCRLDSRIDAGEELSGHAIRGRLAGEQRLRLDLQALGIGPREAPKPAPRHAGPKPKPAAARYDPDDAIQRLLMDAAR